MVLSRNAACHCGAVTFCFSMPERPLIRRCNCSICAMKGVVMLDVPMNDLEVTGGQDRISTYSFGSGAARHHFCAVCGIHTFHQLRSEPDHYGVNLACVEGLSPYDLAEVPVFDGQHHPGDGGPYRYAGTMRYEPAPPTQKGG